ncbi:MAG: hypothetical protein ABIV11_08595 [Gemmatimonadaceae bacterium]
MNIRAELRTNFSIQHIQSAFFFARQCKAIEGAHDGSYNAESIANCRAYATGAVFAAVAFLDATAGEIFLDASEPDGGSLKDQPIDVRRNFEEIWTKSLSKKSAALPKLEKALELAGTPEICSGSRFNKEERPYLDVALVVKLRNRLIHYEPAWLPAELEHRKQVPQRYEFAEQLRGRFAESAMMGGGSPLFHKILGYGCAKWAAESALALADEFYYRMGIVPRYDHVRAALAE